MFDVHGNEITWRGTRFATITGECWATRRDEAEDALRSFKTETEIADEMQKARDESYDEGRDAGKRDAIEFAQTLAGRLEEILDMLDANGGTLDKGDLRASVLERELRQWRVFVESVED